MATFAAASLTSPGVRQPIMVATDLAARGLDFPGTVDHVVNFDFPTTAVDYLHRTGRTARAGKTGERERERSLVCVFVVYLSHLAPKVSVHMSLAIWISLGGNWLRNYYN